MQLTSTRKSAIRRPRRRRRAAGGGYSLPGYLDGLELMYYVDAAESTSWTGSGNWKDLTGNDVDFTPEGSPTHDDTEGGGCFLFDGTDDYFHTDHSAANAVNWSASNSNRNYSVEIWFKTFTSGTYAYSSGTNYVVSHRYPVTHSNSGDNNSYWTAYITESTSSSSRKNKVSVRKKYGGSSLATDYLSSSSNAVFTRDAWNHVVHTWDFASTGSTGGKILYDQSGTIYASSGTMNLSDFDTVDSNASDTGPDGSLCIGGRRENGALIGTTSMKGAIALVRQYNKALSISEVQNIYDNEKSRFGL